MPARHSGSVYVAADNVPDVGWGQATCLSLCPLVAQCARPLRMRENSSLRSRSPAASATGHTARLALLHGEGTPSHIQAIAPGSLRLRLHAATALQSSRATSGLSTFP